MRRHLTDLVVQKLVPPAQGRYDVWCSDLPRFGIRIGPGRKTWIVNTGTTRKKIGIYPHMGLKDAKNAAKRLLYADLFPEAAPSAPSLVPDYLKAISHDRKPGTVNVYSIYLRRIPNEPLNTLTPKMLYAALPPGKGAANLCFNVFKAYLSWCVERGHLETNCLLKRRKPHSLQSRQRLLSDSEVSTIWDHSYHHNQFGVLLRVLLLSGQRLSQITHLQWGWLDTELISFPPFIMKGNTEHTIPLTPQMSLHMNRQIYSSPTENPSSPNTTNYIWGDKPFSNVHVHMRNFRKTLPQIPHWSLHDFRRYFSSTCSKLKVQIDITEAILAHKGGSRSAIQRVYDRDTRIPQMRDALERYHEYLYRNVLKTDGT